MRFNFCVFAVVLLSGPLALAQTTGPATRPAPAMQVAPNGTLSVAFIGKTILEGHWQIAHYPYDHADDDELVLGDILSTKVTTESPTRAVVVDQYRAARVTSQMNLDGEDLQISTHIENQDKSKAIKKVNFSGMLVHFSKPADGTLSSFFYTYLQEKGVSLYHPSLAEPVGAVYARGDQFGFCVHSNTEFDRQALFNAEFEKDNIIPANCRLQYFTIRGVAAGESIDVDLNVRISSDTSAAHLLGAYKKIYDQHLPKLLYNPDNRPMAACTAVGPKVSRSNPYGFIGVTHRFDTAAGVGAYIRQVPPVLEQANALGLIIWSPGGNRPPMYPPDFDVFPDPVQDNLPMLIEGFRKHHLRVGLCARCENGVIREQGKEPVLTQLHFDNQKEMQELLERFHHALNMGFDIFYLDSFGDNNPNDQEMLKQIRADLGPDVLLYTEYCSDLSLPYAGHYCEWYGNYILWTSPQQYECLRYLCPDSTWLCVSKGPGARPVPPEFAKLKLTPLVDDMASNRLPASQPAK